MTVSSFCFGCLIVFVFCLFPQVHARLKAVYLLFGLSLSPPLSLSLSFFLDTLHACLIPREHHIRLNYVVPGWWDENVRTTAYENMKFIEANLYLTRRSLKYENDHF